MESVSAFADARDSCSSFRSLSSECTPLKHKYDSCFNAWFEGYLQPALDGSSLRPHRPLPSLQENTSQDKTAPEPPDSGIITQPISDLRAKHQRTNLTTTWSNAIGKSSRSNAPSQSSTLSDEGPTVHDGERPVQPFKRVLDIAGVENMPRAARKAAEYDQACGQLWQGYRSCLVASPACFEMVVRSQKQKAIGRNQSLTTLLEQARTEHPLENQRNLEGTPWDPQYRPPD